MRRRSPSAGCVKLPMRKALEVQERRPAMKNNTSSKQNTSKGEQSGQGKVMFAFYIGIDLGDKTSDVCVMNPAGEVHKEFRLGMNAEQIHEYFAAIEVGGQSQWVAEAI